MAPFFKYCPICSRCYTSPEDWNAHAAKHAAALKEERERKAQMASVVSASDTPEVAREKQQAGEVPNADRAVEEDDRLARVRSLRVMKRKLKAVGIECATMTEEETLKEWRKAVKSGLVADK